MMISKLKNIVKTEKMDVSDDAIFPIVRASDGSMRDAESVLDQLASFCEKKISQEDVIALLGIIEEDKLASVVGMLSKRDTAGLLKAVDDLIVKGKDMSQFLIGLMGYLRNMMVLKVSSGLSSLIDLPENHITRLKAETDNFKIDELLYMFYTISATANAIKRSEVSRFIVESSLIKLSLRDEMMSLPEIIEKISHLESNISGYNSFSNRPKGQVAEDERRLAAETKEKALDKDSVDIKAKSPEPIEKSSDIQDRETELAEAGPADKSQNAIQLIAESVKKIWPKVIQAIKSKKISIASYLNEGRIVGFKGSVIKLGFGKKSNFYKEALEHLNNKKFVEDTASDLFGQKIQLEFVTLEESEEDVLKIGNSLNLNVDEELEDETEKSAFDDPIIQSAIEIFNGKIIKGEGGPPSR
jgi:DNA polymerase-3 subunit gamma/tau